MGTTTPASPAMKSLLVLATLAIATLSSPLRSEEEEVSCAGVYTGAFFADPEECSLYYVCVHGDAVSMPCPAGLAWNTDLNTCDWPDNVDCDDDSSSSSSSSEECTDIDGDGVVDVCEESSEESSEECEEGEECEEEEEEEEEMVIVNMK